MNKLVLITLIVVLSFSFVVFARADGLFGGSSSGSNATPPASSGYQCPNLNAVNDTPLGRSASPAVGSNTYSASASQNYYSASNNYNSAPTSTVNNSYINTSSSYSQNFYAQYGLNYSYPASNTQGSLPRYMTDPYGLGREMAKNIYALNVPQPWHKGSVNPY